MGQPDSRDPDLDPLPRRIVLTGFMGAGKSTVGRLLAARLGWPFADIDALVAAEQGHAVAEIFARQGEPHFRRLEAEAVARLLAPEHSYPHAVVALGGGAIETASVRDMLAGPAQSPGTVTVFLSAPLDELLSRCRVSGPEDAPARPLLAAPEPPADRLARRLPLYRQAHLTVETAGLSPDQVAAHIARWLSTRESHR